MSERHLLKLLAVLQARRFWPGPDLAEKLEVTPRTLRRAIDDLRSLGYRVESTSGPGGGYQLGRGTELPPLMLDEEEAITVTVALQAALGTFAGLGEPVLRLLVKLEQLLPKSLHKRLKALAKSTLMLAHARGQTDPAVLSLLANACIEQRQLRFTYTSASNEDSERHVEPARLIQTGAGRWYLLAWDVSKDDYRLFRVDRMVNPMPQTAQFAPRPLPDNLQGYVSQRLTSDPYALRAVVRVKAAAEEVRRGIPPWIGTVEAETFDTALLTWGAPDLQSLSTHLSWLRHEFEVVSPPELRATLRDISQRFQRAAAHNEA